MKNIPELRFPEFKNEPEWEEKKLSEVSSYVDYRGRAPVKTENGHFLVTARNIKKGFIDYECSKEYVAENDYLNVMSKGLPEVGDVLFTTEAPMGNVALVDNQSIALAQRVIKFRSKKMLLNTYLLHYMLSDVFQQDILNKSIGTTVQGISGKELHQIKLLLPSKPEQQKIADCLSSIDNLITAQSKKVEALKKHKNGLMQQLFPQEGEEVPKLRFPEFKNAPKWEEKLLSELLTIGSGRDYKHLSDGKVPVYGTGGYMLSVDDYLYDGESVCIGRKGTIDKPMFLTGKFWTVDTLFYTHSFKHCIPKYIFYYFGTINWYNYNEAGGVPSLSKTTINKISIPVPSKDDLKEQQKIADCLNSIDELITSLAKKVETLKEHKKGLMQKLFPSNEVEK